MAAETPFSIRTALPEDRLPLQRMLELYQYELSDFWEQHLDAHGEYGYALDRYWGHPACLPLLATWQGHPAGFALVDGAVRVGTQGHWMDQFFVLKRYRRAGLGARLAQHAFRARPGPWEVGQMTANLAAQAFWRRVIGAFTGGVYVEHTLTAGPWQGVVQAFTVAPGAAPPHAPG